MIETEVLVFFLVLYAVIAWGMFQAGKWKGDRDAWREADADSTKLACVEFDLEEMTTQRDMLAGYADMLEARLPATYAGETKGADEPCPFCGESDGWNGQGCFKCGYVTNDTKPNA